jgi:hypothetical protein
MSQQDNNKSNAFFSAFSGGNGGGGGGGEVNTASNIGVGLGTFKQKVSEDLEFRSLLQAKGIILNYSISDEEIEIQQEVGVVGIGDGTGFYTFYSDVNSAIASATAGQTIKFFADILETGAVSIVLKNGVDIDLNGFTYTLDSATSVNMIADTSEIVDVTIRNGNLIRLNAVPTTASNGLAIYIDRSATKLTLDQNVYVENVGNLVLLMTRGGTINGGIWVGGSANYGRSATLNGRVDNAYFNVTQEVVSGADCSNCIFYNQEEFGVALNSVANSVSDSIIISKEQNRLSGSTMIRCSITNAVGSALLVVSGYVIDCYLRGVNGDAYNVYDAVLKCTTNTYVWNTNVIAEVGLCVSLNQSEMSNSSCFSFNNAVGVVYAETGAYISNNSINNLVTSLVNQNAIIVENDGVVIVGNQLKIGNTASFGITTLGSVKTAYISSNTLFTGTFTDVTKITNIQSNTPDSYGNILIG